jgi:hypothetical protein
MGWGELHDTMYDRLKRPLESRVRQGAKPVSAQGPVPAGAIIG